jgi:hypothetical protein
LEGNGSAIAEHNAAAVVDVLHPQVKAACLAPGRCLHISSDGLGETDGQGDRVWSCGFFSRLLICSVFCHGCIGVVNDRRFFRGPAPASGQEQAAYQQ